MITRSKARAMQAQGNTKAPGTVPVHRPAQHPSSHIPNETSRARRLDQIRSTQHGQNQHAEMEAALLAAINQRAANHDQATLARAGPGQQGIDDAVFEAARLEQLATIAARQALLRTSCKIAGKFFQIAVMACEASDEVQEEMASVLSYVTAEQVGVRLGIWLGTFAVAMFVVLLHLFDVLCVRRIGTRESLAERVTASTAMFLGVGAVLEAGLEFTMVLQLWRRAVGVAL